MRTRSLRLRLFLAGAAGHRRRAGARRLRPRAAVRASSRAHDGRRHRDLCPQDRLRADRRRLRGTPARHSQRRPTRASSGCIPASIGRSRRDDERRYRALAVARRQEPRLSGRLRERTIVIRYYRHARALRAIRCAAASAASRSATRRRRCACACSRRSISSPSRARATPSPRSCVATLLLIALGLAFAMWMQVGLGLAPLARLCAEVGEIARGARRRLDQEAPREVQALVDEVNGLLGRAREGDRARAQSRRRSRPWLEDAAHRARRRRAAPARARRDSISRNRSIASATPCTAMWSASWRGRAAASCARGGSRRRSPKWSTRWRARWRAPAPRRVFDLRIAPGARVAVERVDLMEILGNLMENAARHARAACAISAAGGRFVVEDDGPGLPAESEALIRERGGRLDETRRRRPRPRHRAGRARRLWRDDALLALRSRRTARRGGSVPLACGRTKRRSPAYVACRNERRRVTRRARPSGRARSPRERRA